MYMYIVQVHSVNIINFLRKIKCFQREAKILDVQPKMRMENMPGNWLYQFTIIFLTAFCNGVLIRHLIIYLQFSTRSIEYSI